MKFRKEQILDSLAHSFFGILPAIEKCSGGEHFFSGVYLILQQPVLLFYSNLGGITPFRNRIQSSLYHRKFLTAFLKLLKKAFCIGMKDFIFLFLLNQFFQILKIFCGGSAAMVAYPPKE